MDGLFVEYGMKECVERRKIGGSEMNSMNQVMGIYRLEKGLEWEKISSN